MQFSLEQFSSVLKIRNPEGRPYILIGGQAVNFWATRYVSEEPQLSGWLPFTSQDIDFKGTRSDAIHIAQQLDRRAKLPAMVEMTALAGIVPLKIEDMETNIEIVRQIPGVKEKEVDEQAFEREFAGHKIRVLDPISLLCCKAELTLKVSQEGRRDVDHLKIMVHCVRAFLREALQETEREPDLQKGWLGAMERVLALAESGKGAKISRRFDIDWMALLPEKEITICNLPKVVKFRRERLLRWTDKMNRQSKGV